MSLSKEYQLSDITTVDAWLYWVHLVRPDDIVEVERLNVTPL